MTRMLPETSSPTREQKLRMATVQGFMLKALPHDARERFKWFATDNSTADPVAIRKEFPGVRTFEQWLREGNQNLTE